MFAMAFQTVNYESNTAGFQLTLLLYRPIRSYHTAYSLNLPQK